MGHGEWRRIVKNDTDGDSNEDNDDDDDAIQMTTMMMMMTTTMTPSVVVEQPQHPQPLSPPSSLHHHHHQDSSSSSSTPTAVTTTTTKRSDDTTPATTTTATTTTTTTARTGCCCDCVTTAAAAMTVLQQEFQFHHHHSNEEDHPIGNTIQHHNNNNNTNGNSNSTGNTNNDSDSDDQDDTPDTAVSPFTGTTSSSSSRCCSIDSGYCGGGGGDDDEVSMPVSSMMDVRWLDHQIQLSMQLIQHVPNIVMELVGMKKHRDNHHCRSRDDRHTIKNHRDNDDEYKKWRWYTHCIRCTCRPIPIILAVHQILLLLQRQQQQQQQQQKDVSRDSNSNSSSSSSSCILNYMVQYLLPTILFPKMSSVVAGINNKSHNNKVGGTTTTPLPLLVLPSSLPQMNNNNTNNNDIVSSLSLSCVWHATVHLNSATNVISIILSVPQHIQSICRDHYASVNHTTTGTGTGTSICDDEDDTNDLPQRQQQQRRRSPMLVLPKYIREESMYYEHCIVASFDAAISEQSISHSDHNDNNNNNSHASSIILFRTLIRYLLRRNNGRSVAQGMVRLYHDYTQRTNDAMNDDNFSLRWCQLLIHVPNTNGTDPTKISTSINNSIFSGNDDDDNNNNNNNRLYLSNMEIAIFYRAVLRHIIATTHKQHQQNQSSGNNYSHDSNNELVVLDRITNVVMDMFHPSILHYYSSDICQCIVLSSTSCFSGSSNINNSTSDQNKNKKIPQTTASSTIMTNVTSPNRLLCHVFALHLSRTTPSSMRINNNDDANNNDNDDDDDSAVSETTNTVGLLESELPNTSNTTTSEPTSSKHQPSLILLYQQLCHVAISWSDMTFIYQADIALQQHITGFLLSGISILVEHRSSPREQRQGSEVPSEGTSKYILLYTTLATRLIEGVTYRMSSTRTSIRHDGMHVGQHLASLLGQPDLKFDELMSTNDDESCVNSTTSENDRQGIGGIVDKCVTQDDDNVCNVNDPADDDSDWDDDNNSVISEPYDIDDDQQDLRFVPQPLYLSECLDYLRTPETEEQVYHRHEAVLQNLSRLVRTRPADLIDNGPELARILLRLEDRYNMTNFSTFVSDSLCALVVADPIAVGINLIEELFEDGSLRDRLSVLHALDEASYELSGYKQLENKKNSVENRLDLSRTAGKRELQLQASNDAMNTTIWNGTLADRTRRWGKGRHPVVEPKMIENRFAKVGPEWFYLLTGRFVHCKDNTTLWGGEVGATLLSSLILSLTRIVSCTGPYTPGVDVLAKDLLELVWPLRIANVVTVRSSVLYAVGTALCYIPEQTILSMIIDSSTDNFIMNIQCICENDTDSDCRALAQQLRTIVTTAVLAMDEPHLLT